MIEEKIYICLSCVKQRCYRFPILDISIQAKIANCSYCGYHGSVWNLDDLIPGWKDDNGMG